MIEVVEQMGMAGPSDAYAISGDCEMPEEGDELVCFLPPDNERVDLTVLEVEPEPAGEWIAWVEETNIAT